MKEIFKKKRYMLLFFSIVLLIFCIVYKNTPNGISKLISDLFDIAETSDASVANDFNRMNEVTQSGFIQFPIRFINAVLSIYIEALIVFLPLKIFNKFSKNKKDITFKKIVDAFYYSLYIITANLAIQTIYMLVVGQSLDYTIDVYYVIYMTLMSVTKASMIITVIKKKCNVIVVPSIVLITETIIQALIAKGGL